MAVLKTISIITVCLNSESSIEKTIKSVISQQLNGFDLEYIVIDGGSTDKTLEIISQYTAQISILISEPDKGIYDAMNKGIQLATGDIIGILNSDDQYFPDTFSFVAEHFDPYQIIAGICLRPDGTTNQLKKKTGPRFQKKKTLSKLKYVMALDHPAMFISKLIYDQYGLYDTSYKICADYNWVANAWIQGCQFNIIDKPLTLFSPGGISDMNRIQVSIENRKIQLQLALSDPFRINLYFLYRIVIRLNLRSLLYFLKIKTS